MTCIVFTFRFPFPCNLGAICVLMCCNALSLSPTGLLYVILVLLWCKNCCIDYLCIYSSTFIPSVSFDKRQDCYLARYGFGFQVLYHAYNKEDQLAALKEEKRILEERKKLKESGVIGSTMDTLDGEASLVGSGIGLVGTSIDAGAEIVGSGLRTVGSNMSKAENSWAEP